MQHHRGGREGGRERIRKMGREIQLEKMQRLAKAPKKPYWVSGARRWSGDLWRLWMVQLKDEATVQHSRKSQMMTGVVEMNTQHTRDNNLSTQESRRAFYSPKSTCARVQTCTF